MKKDIVTITNELKCTIPAKSINEGFSRMLISSFCASLDPTIEEISDIKTAVSEAVTNCIVHAYSGFPSNAKKIYITAKIYSNKTIIIKIRDKGIGIPDIKKAMQPLYSGSGNDERSGMGFSIMESFTDGLKVHSKVGTGTTITMKKSIGNYIANE